MQEILYDMWLNGASQQSSIVFKCRCKKSRWSADDTV